jgi:hypothetical protein
LSLLRRRVGMVARQGMQLGMEEEEVVVVVASSNRVMDNFRISSLEGDINSMANSSKNMVMVVVWGMDNRCMHSNLASMLVINSNNNNSSSSLTAHLTFNVSNSNSRSSKFHT